MDLGTLEGIEPFTEQFVLLWLLFSSSQSFHCKIRQQGNYMPFTPQDFVSKWKRVTAREKQTYQEHFIDLCHLAGHQTPNDYDPTGTRFGFEMGAAKTSGGQGWADVAKLGYITWHMDGSLSCLMRRYWRSI